MKKVLVLFAQGFENVEALMTVDILRRGKVDVVNASITEEDVVTASNGVSILADATLDQVELDEFDAVILPGGMPGTTNLSESDVVRKIVMAMNEAGKIVAAICAAPSVLGKYGLLKDKNASCFPSFEDKLIDAKVNDKPVNIDGNIVTSRGLGTSEDFAYALLGMLMGEDMVKEIKAKTVYQKRA